MATTSTYPIYWRDLHEDEGAPTEVIRAGEKIWG